jgi:hypothetical protein
MKTISSRSVRYAYLMFLMALAAFAVLEPLVGRPAAAAATVAEGLSTCGTVEQPCTLEAVTVAAKAQPRTPAPVQVAEGLAACGSEAQPCRLETVQVTAEPSTGRFAAAERSVGMTLRVRS